jgi:hypothetical protein
MRRLSAIVGIVFLASSAVFAAPLEEMTKPTKSAKPSNHPKEITQPSKSSGGNRPDITDGKGGVVIGGAVGGAGGLFVPWGGYADISGVAPLPGASGPGRCAFNVTYVEKNDAPVQTAPMYTNKLRVGASDVAVNGARHLNAGESKSATTQPYLSEGTHVLTLALDSLGAVAESQEGNNQYSIKYTLRCSHSPGQAKPDLVPVLSSPMNGTVSVKNIGTGAAGASKLVLKCVKLGNTGGGGGCADIPPALAAPYIDAAFPNSVVVNVPALAPGASYNHALSFWGALVWPKGKYQFNAAADAGAVVAETNEANNAASSVLAVP